MTEEETKTAIKEFLEAYCNNDFSTETPGAITLAIDRIYQGLNNKKEGVQSESINGDLSVSYSQVESVITPEVDSLLSPYKRLKW